MWRITTLLTVTLALISGCLVSGCNEWGIIRPRSAVSINPLTKEITFTNTKDTDLTVENVQAQWATTQPEGTGSSGNVLVGKLVLADKSSSVIEQNVKQMEVSVKQMEQTRAMIETTFNGISSLLPGISAIIGELRTTTSQLRSLQTPFGSATSSNTTTPASTQPATTSRGDAVPQ